MAERVELGTRVSEADIRQLRIGQKVYLTGTFFTVMRPWHFTRSLELLRRGEPLPMAVNDSFLGHCGAVYRERADGTLKVTEVGPTTSSKFNEFTPEFIKLSGIRGVIGKGGMDKATQVAMQEHGAVYLSMIGGCTATYTCGVEGIVRKYWEQPNWTENVLELKVRNFGPLFVGIDANGNSVYEEARARTEAAMLQMNRRLFHQ
ncbi:FumA C-terminus/TtdB family hydratase beta subunit [Metabacillus arenae]|uniref:Fumarate hydratase C-terminal domain-containing protein n=1 Tax=Metabacillus arenae TaxID=2771434 RepID=A0A926NDL2_9BACI|nr:FumA C-terminus/TtdB family hydratase beta subunit [Metabacillus arenae]MBD1382312.1 fumarate hydratase C-terminal domain-containing protein [Metabacillus arenae]